jgi:hypothetical protein
MFKKEKIMNKHIINVLSNYNFTYEKNLGYGSINGYEVNVVNNPTSVGPVLFISTFLTQSQKNDFVLRVNNLKTKLLYANSFEFGVSVTIGALTGRLFEKNAGETITKVFEILSLLNAPKSDICPLSGDVLDETNCRIARINGLKFKLTNTAIETFNSTIEKSNECYQNAPNNYLKGLLGIIIGALVGVLLTLILWYVGFVTTIAPLVSIFLGIYLYKKFGGKQNWFMVLMSFVVTLVFILTAFIMVYAITAKVAANNQGITIGMFKALKYCLVSNDEYRKTFYTDLSLNAFFILLAEGLSIYSLVKSIRRPNQI